VPAHVESMFSVREMPWHRQGIVTGQYPGSWADARKLAGLDWDPVTEPVYAVEGVNPDGRRITRQSRDGNASRVRTLPRHCGSTGTATP
jgi:hypothetical protein